MIEVVERVFNFDIEEPDINSYSNLSSKDKSNYEQGCSKKEQLDFYEDLFIKGKIFEGLEITNRYDMDCFYLYHCIMGINSMYPCDDDSKFPEFDKEYRELLKAFKIQKDEQLKEFHSR